LASKGLGRFRRPIADLGGAAYRFRMMGDHDRVADDKILAAWVAGWALSRGVGPPTPAYGGLRVDVGLPDQKARYVFAGVCPGIEEASRAIREPHVFLKVCAPPSSVQPLLHPGWVIQPVSYFMTTDSLHRPEPPLAAGYRVDCRREGPGHVATVITESGQAAASGRAFLVGDVAVFDQIVTDPAHQRRGLGRAVMGALENAAGAAGASTGALVATPDGQALYRTIGWALRSLYTTAVRE
jgi:GNAT superfamily N-acetyltransferase